MSDPILALLIETARPEIERFVRELVEHELAAVAVPELDVWMTTTEAAHYLRLSPEALRARVRRGSIPAHRDEHRWLFHRDELDDHLRHRDQDGRYSAARQQLVAPATAVTVRGRDLKE